MVEFSRWGLTESVSIDVCVFAAFLRNFVSCIFFQSTFIIYLP